MKNLSLILDFSASLSVGLVEDAADGSRVLSFRIREQGTRGESAHALLEECLAETGRGIADIASICVGVGPGSFTGIRVCAAMAQGLAFAERLPLYPFSSLAGILTGASGVSGPSGVPGRAGRAVSAIAANGGRYFVRWRESEAESAPAASAAPAQAPHMHREALLSADALLALGSPDTVLITAGNFPDRERMRPAFAALGRHEEAADFPALARLARSAPPVTDGVLRPNYLMASAAEEKRRSGEAPR